MLYIIKKVCYYPSDSLSFLIMKEIKEKNSALFYLIPLVTLPAKTLRQWRRKLENLTEDGNITCAHGLVELILWYNCPIKSNTQVESNSHKIPTQIFTQFEKICLKFIREHRRPRIFKTILYNKNNDKEFTITDFN